MKLSVNVEADAINVLALNMGRIVVDIDGIELSELIAAVNLNGCTLRIADEPGKISCRDGYHTLFSDFLVNHHQTIIAVIAIKPENPRQNASFLITPDASFHSITCRHIPLPGSQDRRNPSTRKQK
ncbi:YeeU family antitoxin [Trabulsiella guamensis ATCC 49490]|uniref:YeeU family antitoxin n=1 Tax=Trabulsiella guamensis ATCC 49490 TaxID=1005994 RepID=A0A085A7R2_9ENTR|nr:YeeU family antitoxin [Trabulsiella guamensis ATCC 49490]